jgi:hypothetical protein
MLTKEMIECILSRDSPICPAKVGHRSATVCHLAHIGYRLCRPLNWDQAREQFIQDDEANALLSREPRKPWSYA